ncbi:LysR family transcriptional regulator [Vibrio superstes]|uniref:LysR family transcriptional regulator n=1 Tax=Vibrio superstes NBRC 103154 TaxID=1219062 RepID=A0A511QRE4_9VIBR|nr:LysR family transcriptional regulator [Vibrio superstes]GEM79891.1 LysR family transcriptional regulator [Vibrio superstes NBRC 103154]
MKTKLHDLDLNLLKYLEAIVHSGSTAAAAEHLGVSQASVSRGLATLRETFGDELFIRRAHGVEPSDLAVKLAEANAEMLRPLSQIIDSYQDFDPKMFEGTIRIAINIIILELHGDGLFSQLRNTFPKADFELIYWQENSLSQVLDGNIDYIVLFASQNLPQNIYRHTLKEVDLCLVARKDHPILSLNSDWENIHDLPIAKIIVDGVKTKHSKIEEYYAYKGYRARVSLSTHSVRVIINKLVNSDAIMFGSQFVSTLDEQLCRYSLPLLPEGLRTSEVCGGYLQSRRGVPFYSALQQSVQHYFTKI